MKIKKPNTLEEAWAIIQAQALLIEELQKQVNLLTQEIEKLKKNQKRKDPPSFIKENKKKKRKKKKGPKFGHDFFGFLRFKKKVDEKKRWFLKKCPDCGDKVSKSIDKFTRHEVDIPPVEPIVRQHTIGRHWCSGCRKIVSASVPGLMPNTPFSQNIHLRVAHLKFGLGLTLGKIQALLYEVYGLKISSGGLSEMLSRLGGKMEPVHEALKEKAGEQSVLNADETGWRVDGINHWLWSFSSASMVYYHIDQSRGQKVVSLVLGESFSGVLVTDFYSAYNLIQAIKQKCWVHVLRDIKKVESEETKDEEALKFASKLKRKIKLSLTLKSQQELLDPITFSKRKQKVQMAILNTLELTSKNSFVRRMSKRISKYRRELFVFLEQKGVPSHNNDAERQIRPAVLMRKISYQNASIKGAKTQAVLMSVIQTCRKSKIDFFEWGRQYLDARGPPQTPFTILSTST